MRRVRVACASVGDLTGQLSLDVVNGHGARGAGHLERVPAEVELLPQVPSCRIRRIGHIRMLRLPLGPQLRVLREEILDGLVELRLECLQLIDQLRHMVPRHEVCVGRRKGSRAIRAAGFSLRGHTARAKATRLTDLLKDLAAPVRIDQLLRAERGDCLALDLGRRQVEIPRLVADATGPSARTG